MNWRQRCRKVTPGLWDAWHTVPRARRVCAESWGWKHSFVGSSKWASVETWPQEVNSSLNCRQSSFGSKACCLTPAKNCRCRKHVGMKKILIIEDDPIVAH